MKVAIMQPYFFPYIGYFKLINSVNKFVVYDNVQFTKKGWINRNRVLVNSRPHLFTIPVKGDSSVLNVQDRELAGESLRERYAILKVVRNTYSRAPFFGKVYPFIEDSFLNSQINLFSFIHSSIVDLCRFMDIKTEIIVSSSLEIDHSLNSSNKVLAICKHLNAKTYLNSPNGKHLYQVEEFKKNEIDLVFQRDSFPRYRQFKKEFVPYLSIIDTLMFCDIHKIKDYIVCANPENEKQQETSLQSTQYLLSD